MTLAHPSGVTQQFFNCIPVVSFSWNWKRQKTTIDCSSNAEVFPKHDAEKCCFLKLEVSWKYAYARQVKVDSNYSKIFSYLRIKLRPQPHWYYQQTDL